MDLVSLETVAENDFIKNRMESAKVAFIWTSGRKCNFDGCDRPEYQPVIENGWFWAGSGVRIGSTRNPQNGEWSHTGLIDRPQPDNREGTGPNAVDEGCLTILNNLYDDGIKWHDLNCDYRKSYVCEDSDELLDYVRSRNPGIKLWAQRYNQRKRWSSMSPTTNRRLHLVQNKTNRLIDIPL